MFLQLISNLHASQVMDIRNRYNMPHISENCCFLPLFLLYPCMMIWKHLLRPSVQTGQLMTYIFVCVNNLHEFCKVSSVEFSRNQNVPFFQSCPYEKSYMAVYLLKEYFSHITLAQMYSKKLWSFSCLYLIGLCWWGILGVISEQNQKKNSGKKKLTVKPFF